jgi:hypothetical protein
VIDLGEPATTEFLHSGCSLLVCTVGVGGHPRAARAWGLTVVDPPAGRLRLLVEADDHITVANLRGGGGVAVTATNVITYRSMQLKGRGLGIEEPMPEDEAKRDQYTHDFLYDVHAANSYQIDMLERWARRPIIASLIEVDSSFDQTPGPSAGVAIDRGVA